MKIRQELPDDDVDLTTFYNPMFQKSNILPLGAEQLPEYADVIRRSFATIAKDFGWTKENCPSHTSFVTNERLGCKIKNGYYPFALSIDNKIIGFVSLSDMGSGAFEMNDVSILPKYRHFGYGKKMLDFCKAKVRELGGSKIAIGIVEKNAVLKDWYGANGFVHTCTKKFDHLPFTVGFMEWSTAFYMSIIPDPILTQNKASWEAMADDTGSVLPRCLHTDAYARQRMNSIYSVTSLVKRFWISAVAADIRLNGAATGARGNYGGLTYRQSRLKTP